MGRFRWHRVREVVRGKNSTIRIKPIKYEEEYTKTPEYPPILDTSYAGIKQRAANALAESVKNVTTVEGKLMKINMPKYYGWKTVIVKESRDIPYNALPFAQYITRTHFLGSADLPYKHLEEESAKLLEQVKPQIEEALVFEYKYRSRKHQHNSTEESPISVVTLDNILAKSVIQQINRILLSSLSDKMPHLISCQIDTDPRLESFWLVGWQSHSELYLKRRAKRPVIKDLPLDPLDRWIQYYGSPVLHLRHELPLPEVVDIQESENTNYEVPEFDYSPQVLGIPHELRVGTNIPGFWPGDCCEFGVMSFHNRGHMLKRPSHYGEEDNAEALHTQAILASYGWLLPQACYQGFSTYNDVTYPLVTQTVITNGKLWSFYVYQLNTTLIHANHAISNPRRNLCWGTPELKLFEEITDGRVIGLNDEVLKNLIMFYLNKPRVREGIEMKPYLGKEEKVIADIADEKRRVWLENAFKHMYSGRPRNRLVPEIYEWERIYKLKHKTRPIEARRRPFELRINPFNRRYDEHTPRYIPKALREKGKYRKKFEDTYYP